MYNTVSFVGTGNDDFFSFPVQVHCHQVLPIQGFPTSIRLRRRTTQMTRTESTDKDIPIYQVKANTDDVIKQWFLSIEFKKAPLEIKASVRWYLKRERELRERERERGIERNREEECV